MPAKYRDFSPQGRKTKKLLDDHSSSRSGDVDMRDVEEAEDTAGAPADNSSSSSSSSALKDATNSHQTNKQAAAAPAEVKPTIAAVKKSQQQPDLAKIGVGTFSIDKDSVRGM